MGMLGTKATVGIPIMGVVNGKIVNLAVVLGLVQITKGAVRQQMISRLTR